VHFTDAVVELVCLAQSLVSGLKRGLGSHAAQIDNITFTPDGRRIISGGDDGAVIVWDATTAAPIVQVRDRDSVIGRAGAR